VKKKLPPKESIRHLANNVAKEFDADVILYSGSIEEPADFELIGRISRLGKRKNAILFLTTYGGIADVAYRMMRFLQARYHDGKITAYIPHICKSAGTLMVIGADEVVMSSFAELGPLDVQVSKPDEVGEWTSGLTPLQALSAIRGEAFNSFEQHFLMLREKSGKQITAKTAADIAARLTVGWFQPLYEQIDPMRLGETVRAMTIAREYGMRLSRGNIELDGLDDLISSYPSHGFVIDREEAAQLFKHVRGPQMPEGKLASALMASRLVDSGLTGDGPVVRVISEEDCDFSTDNGWEGIEYDDEITIDKRAAKTPGASGRRSAPVGAGDQKSIPAPNDRKKTSDPSGTVKSRMDGNGR
jgi:hypothetical protein